MLTSHHINLSSFGGHIRNQLEGCFYRRRSDQATYLKNKNDWMYHNHILQGSYLRYIRRALKTEETSSFRLVLVAGKAKGRLKEMLLTPDSEVTTAILSESEAPGGGSGKYIVNVSGKNIEGIEERWQLAMATLKDQNDWVEALGQAKNSQIIVQESGDYEKLKVLARKMLHEIDVRNRMRRFKIHRGVFIGTVAVKWISSELSCSNSQAVHFGNMMLNCGLFHHVGREHVFCDRKLYYRFADDLSFRNVDEPGIELLTADNQNQYTTRDMRELERLRTKCTSFTNKFTDIGSCLHEMKSRIIFLELVISVIVLILLSLGFCSYLGNNRFKQYLPYVLVVDVVICSLLCYKSVLFEGKLDSTIENLRKKEISNRKEKDGSGGAVLLDELDEDDEDEDDDDDDDDDDDVQLEGAFSELELMLEEEEEEEGADDEDYNDTSPGHDRHRNSGEEEAALHRSFNYETEIERKNLNQRRTLPQSPIPALETWPNRPILVRRSPNMLPSSMLVNEADSSEANDLLAPLTLHADSHNVEFPVDSDLFVGKMIIMIKNVDGASSQYFFHRKRKFRALLQGRFKTALPFSSVYSGQVFDEPIKSLPAKWIVRVVLQLLAKLQPAFRVSMKGDKPYFLTPLVSLAQYIDISRIGTEPKLQIDEDFEEDMSLLGRKYSGMSNKRRKAHFSRRKNLLKHFYDPNLVYTFDFYQHILNLASFEADIGVIKYDLLKFLGSRPVQIMAVVWDPVDGSAADDQDELETKSRSRTRARSGSRLPPSHWSYLYNVEVLHERQTNDQIQFNRNSSQSDMINDSAGSQSISPKAPKKGLLGLLFRK